ncbi:MAG: toll/interleukin-1 receptor domain-containing protein, partial [Muribaculaceae bacterium]|nr:toll/interleukin-1 receptor domain-containing protein [Muribaculaceae bacterium]
MKYEIFISYSRKDSVVAEEVCRAFDRAGITYFIDRQENPDDLEIPATLADAIIGSRIFL